MTCKDCVPYCTTIPDCLETLGIVTDSPDTQVLVTIIDKFKNEYKWDVLTESSGLLLIDLKREDLPVSLLNTFAGKFTLSMMDHNGDVVRVVKDPNMYDCVEFSVRTTFPARENAYYIGYKYNGAY